MPAASLLVSTLIGLGAIIVYLCGERSSLTPSKIGALESSTWDVKYHLGGNSPWLPKATNISRNIPHGCFVDQVHLMARHGERYPTFRTGERMLELYQRLQHAKIPLNGSLSFTNNWDFFAPFPNDQFEQLTSTGPFAGTSQSFLAGVQFRTRYERLIELAKANAQTSFWASDCTRVIDSARYFATGLFGLDWDKVSTLHIIPESISTGGNTLTPGRACPRYAIDPRGHAFGSSNLMTFRESYLPSIIARLQEENPEFVFSPQEIYSMQEMCGFELLAKGHTKWCDVFTTDEILGFEYARDILHYYRAGPGNLFGPSMGWLWLNATANLLRQPSSDGPLFLSFVHDGDIIAMLSALALFPQTPHLPTTHILHDRTWRFSDVTPMSARITLERFVCPAPQQCWDNAEYGYPNHVYCTPAKNDTFVRIDVNDGIVPLPDCDTGPGESCPLEKFLERVRERGESLPPYAELCGLADDVPVGIEFLHQ